MIRRCLSEEHEIIYLIINEAAEAYRGVIPPDRWKSPYMTLDELDHEIAQGVVFWGDEEGGALSGVMGIQPIQDVALIRHAYVRKSRQNRGIAGALLTELRKQTQRPILVGTWATATWAIRFYEKHGFRFVPVDEKDRLLMKYWSIPDRQIETSVVLADQKWFERRQAELKSL